MKRTPFWYSRILPCFGLFMVLMQPCADLSAESEAGPEQSAKIQAFDVTPVNRRPAILAPNAVTPPMPLPLDSQTREQIFKDLGVDGSAQESIVLSAQTTYLEGKAVLTMALPYTVHPETGVHFKADYPGSVAVKIKVEKDRVYLVDFSLRSAAIGSYRAETEGGATDFDDPEGAREHVVLALKAKSSGWSTVRLKREGSDFFLYSVEVTKL